METPKTPYGLEEHLSTLCQQAPQFKNLHSSWELNKRSCASALKQVAQNYPHYSVHDELHSQNVISNMEQLLGEDRLCKLSPTDTWRLLQLAYLHDFGMLLLYDNIEQEWESADFQEYLRDQPPCCIHVTKRRFYIWIIFPTATPPTISIHAFWRRCCGSGTSWMLTTAGLNPRLSW